MSGATTDDALKVLREAYAAFNARDLPGFLEFFDAESRIIQSEQLPWGGTYVGPDGMRELLDRLTRYIESTLHMVEFVAAGERVLVIGRSRGRAKTTGARFDVRVIHVCEVRGRRVRRLELYPEVRPVLEAIGASPGSDGIPSGGDGDHA